MVTSPNAYWLNFFLKRGVNVMCWNYRSYGKSETSCLDFLNPYVCKTDSERVLDFMVNKLKLKGKIGVYGRSLGGIASCHLANKYPDLIYVLIVDRTFADLEDASTKKLMGCTTKSLYNMFSCNWKILNDLNFAKAKCFKIVTCDPKDEVVDNFASLSVGVSRHLAYFTYAEPKWKEFYACLKFLFDMESLLYSKLGEKTDD